MAWRIGPLLQERNGEVNYLMQHQNNRTRGWLKGPDA